MTESPEQIGNLADGTSKPVLTLLMGADGAGKTSWRDRGKVPLPSWFFDPERVAAGVGDWNTVEAQRRGEELIDHQVDVAIARGDDFGIETTYADERSQELVERAETAGYRIQGYFIGTETPAINIERIHGRVEANEHARRRHRLGPRMGPWIDPGRVRNRYRRALIALRKTVTVFDKLVVLDNSAEASRPPEPTTVLILERGAASYEAERPPRWVASWLEQLQNPGTESRDLGPGGIDWTRCPGLWQDPGRMSGAWCFDRGRVPVSSLFLNLGSGLTEPEFRDVFPMNHDQNVAGVLRHIAGRLRAAGETQAEKAVSDPEAIDWRECPGVEYRTGASTTGWFFQGTDRNLASLFEALAEGESAERYCVRVGDIGQADAADVLDFLAECLESR